MRQHLDEIILSALELAKIGFYRYLFDGTILLIDQTTFDFFELEGIYKDPQLLVGQKIGSLLIYTGPPGRLRAELREKGKVDGFEYGFKTLKGKEKWGIHNSFLFIDEETGKEAVQTCFYDITERKQAEKKLKDITIELEHLIDTSNAVIYRCQPEEDYPATYISENIKQQFGYSPGDFINDPSFWANHIHPEDSPRVFSELSQLLETDSHTHEYRFKHKDGSYRWMLDKLRAIKGSDGKIIEIIGSWIDITEYKNMEIYAQRVRNIDALGILAGGIAHDFNNILVAILGNINLALFDERLKDDTKKLLSDAEKATVRAKKLTQQLLTFSKGGDPVKEVSNLDNVIKDSASFVLHGDKVFCHYDIPEDLWSVEIDRGQISQVIQNIVLNASHAMPEGGRIKVTCENFVSVGRDILPFTKGGRFVKISIQDSGIGMPENVVDKIFDPYFSTKQEGSGLGLSIAHSMIKKHNGHISAESTPGVGSTFTIYLPASEKNKTQTKGSLAEIVTSTRAKILVMDDEKPVRTLAKKMLVKLGHEVVLATDGEEAVKLYQVSMTSGKPIKLAIMDLTIPGGMGGKEAAQEVLKIDPNAKVIASSGYSTGSIMANYKDYGFDAAIAKPYSTQELSEVISQLLD